MIPNNYAGKTPNEVWKEWTASQKIHFIDDHIKDSTPASKEQFAKKAFNFLPAKAKEALKKHIHYGEYAKGGNIKNLQAQKAHLKEAIEGHRKELATLWSNGVKSGEKVEHHKKMMKLDEDKLDNINDKILLYADGGGISDSDWSQHKVVQLLKEVKEDWGEEDLYSDLDEVAVAYFDDKGQFKPAGVKRIKDILENYDVYEDYEHFFSSENSADDSRIDEMVKHWNQHGWAGSHINNDDSEFLERIGSSYSDTPNTSFTGNDIKYYDSERVEIATGGFRDISNNDKYVAIDDVKGFWYIISKPTTKENALKQVTKETERVVTLEEAKAHKKVVGKKYLEDGGEKFAKGGGIKDLAVGMKLGLLNPYNGRYKYSIIEKIEGDKVFLVEKHPTRSQWDNHWDTTKDKIEKFLNEDNRDFKDRKSYVLKFEEGGEIEQTNNEMLQSQLKAVEHHAKELAEIITDKTPVEAWVVGKIERASTDLSDITHYLDGLKFERGGSLNQRRFTKGDFNRLTNDGFEATWEGDGNWDIKEENSNKVLGVFNEDKETIKAIGSKKLDNPLVKWLQQNSFVSNDEYYKLAKGGEIEIGKKVYFNNIEYPKSEGYYGIVTNNKSHPYYAVEVWKNNKHLLDIYPRKSELIYAKGGVVYEVGIDEGEDGTRTIADFDTKKEAQNFMYEYNLKNPDSKLFIDTCASDSGYMAKGGSIKNKFRAYVILNADEFGHLDGEDLKPTKFYISVQQGGTYLWKYEDRLLSNYFTIFKNDEDLKIAIDKVRRGYPDYELTLNKFQKEYLPQSELFEYEKGGEIYFETIKEDVNFKGKKVKLVKTVGGEYDGSMSVISGMSNIGVGKNYEKAVNYFNRTLEGYEKGGKVGGRKKYGE